MAETSYGEDDSSTATRGGAMYTQLCGFPEAEAIEQTIQYNTSAEQFPEHLSVACRDTLGGG